MPTAGPVAACLTLAAACLLATSPRVARADCQPDPPIDGDLVTCSGDNVVGFAVPMGVNDISLYIEAGATFTTTDDAIQVNEDSDILHDGAITIDGVGGIALQGRTRTSITTSAGSSIVLNATDAKAIVVEPTPPEQYANGSVDHAGTITANGDRSWGIAVAAGSDVVSSGTINLNGADSRGIHSVNGPGDAAGGGSISHSGRIDLNGADSFGIDAADHYDVTNDGTIALNAAGGIGILAGNEASVTNASTGSIEISAAAADGVGIQIGDDANATNVGSLVSLGADSAGLLAGEDARLRNDGTLSLSGSGSVGMRGGTGTDITQGAGATITLTADDGIGIEAGSTGLITNSGRITIDGANGRGLYGLDGVGETNAVDQTRFSNLAGSEIVVTGDGGRGVLFGVNSAGTNQGLIEVSGDGSVAAEMGAGSTLINWGTIRISGTDSVGVITGGDTSRVGLNHFVNTPSGGSGVLESLDSAAGPLVQMRESTTNPSQILNVAGAVIRADLTDLSDPDHGIAIQGSAGEDRVLNLGAIQGRIRLGAGADQYVHATSAELVYFEDGQLDGGSGPGDVDQVILQASGQFLGQFDVGVMRNFEELRVETGVWQLDGNAISAADLIVELQGTAVLSESLYMDGSYSHAVPAVGEVAVPALLTFLGHSNADAPLLELSGTADVSGRDLSVVVGGGVHGSQSYTLLQADGGLSGSFDEILLPTAPGLSFGTPVYQGTTLTIPFEVFGYTANELSTSAYLGRIDAAGASPALQAILDDLYSLAYTPYKETLPQLYGEAYDAHASATLELANAMTLATLQRPRYCVAGPDAPQEDPRTGQPCRERLWEPWLTLFGRTGSRTGRDDHISWEDSGGGLLVGADRRFGRHLLISGTLGSAYDSLKVEDVGSGSFTTVDVGLAAQYERGPVLLQGVVSYGHGWHDQSRGILLPGFVRSAEGDYGLDRVGVRVRGEYGFELGGVRLAPLASVDYTALIRSEVVETGAEPLNLVLDGQTDNVVTVRVGGEVAYTVEKEAYWGQLLEATDGIWQPSLAVRWRQVVSGYERDITGRFLGAPVGAAPFSVTGDDARQGFEIGAGVDFTPRLANRLTFGLGYEGFVWEDVGSHNLMGRIRLSF